jgi:hypothetical protein
MSEIRQSTVTALIEKVRHYDYGKYLLRTRLEHVRAFRGPAVTSQIPYPDTFRSILTRFKEGQPFLQICFIQ